MDQTGRLGKVFAWAGTYCGGSGSGGRTAVTGVLTTRDWPGGRANGCRLEDKRPRDEYQFFSGLVLSALPESLAQSRTRITKYYNFLEYKQSIFTRGSQGSMLQST